MNALNQLYADLAARTQATLDTHPDWPCRKGCDTCCRRLAEVPRLTKAEWDCLKNGLAALPTDLLKEIRLGIAALPSSPRPLTCPLLDQSTGACRVYAYRPVACRSYGFYVQRELGLYCKDIEALVTTGEYADVVWGNHDVIDRSLADLGDIRELHEWFEAPCAQATLR